MNVRPGVSANLEPGWLRSELLDPRQSLNRGIGVGSRSTTDSRVGILSSADLMSRAPKLTGEINLLVSRNFNAVAAGSAPDCLLRRTLVAGVSSCLLRAVRPLVVAISALLAVVTIPTLGSVSSVSSLRSTTSGACLRFKVVVDPIGTTTFHTSGWYVSAARRIPVCFPARGTHICHFGLHLSYIRHSFFDVRRISSFSVQLTS